MILWLKRQPLKGARNGAYLSINSFHLLDFFFLQIDISHGRVRFNRFVLFFELIQEFENVESVGGFVEFFAVDEWVFLFNEFVCRENRGWNYVIISGVSRFGNSTTVGVIVRANGVRVSSPWYLRIVVPDVYAIIVIRIREIGDRLIGSPHHGVIKEFPFVWLSLRSTAAKPH